MKKQKGFTLIELILSIAIIAVFITALTYFSIDVFKTKAKAGSVNEVQQNVRFAMQRMTYYIRNSEDGIDTGDSNFSPTDPGRLHLEMGSGANDDIVFDVDANRLRIKIGNAAPVYLTTADVNITSLVFYNNSAVGTPGNVTITLSAEFNNPGGKIEFDYNYDVQTSASLRTP